MTGGQFRKCVTALRWKQVQIAEDLGVLPIKVRKWSAGLDPVPPEVAQWIMKLVRETEQMRIRCPAPVVPRLQARRQRRQTEATPQHAGHD